MGSEASRLKPPFYGAAAQEFSKKNKHMHHRVQKMENR